MIGNHERMVNCRKHPQGNYPGDSRLKIQCRLRGGAPYKRPSFHPGLWSLVRARL